MSKPLPDEIVSELVERMYAGRSGFPLLLGAVSLPAGYAIFHPDPGHDAESFWAVVTVVTTASRIVGGLAYARFGSRRQSPRVQTCWQIAYFVASLSAALSLAGLTIAALWTDDLLLFAWSLATLVGAAYGAVSWVCHRPMVGIPQTTIPILAVAAALAAEGSVITWLMGASLVIAAASIVEHVLRQHKAAVSLIESRREIETLSATDALTGLWNRRRFDEVVAEVTSEAGLTVRLLVIDLDRFKPVNDTYGHEVGDAVLREAGRRIAETVGEGGFVARIGGDEFAVLMLGTLCEAEALADRISDVVSRPFGVGEVTVTIGASVGVSTIRGGDDPATAIRQADERMYARKPKRLAAA